MKLTMKPSPRAFWSICLYGLIGFNVLGIFFNPAQTMRAQRAKGMTDAGNAAILLGFASVSYLLQLSELYHLFQNKVQASPVDAGLIAISFADLAGWRAVWSIFGFALLMYGLATLSHGLAKCFGNKATGVQARRAMFWAAFICLPLIVILHIIQAAGWSNLWLFFCFLTFAYFLWYWQSALYVLGFDDV